MAEQFEMTSRHKEIRDTFMENLNYLIPRYRVMAEASQQGEVDAKFGHMFNQLLDVTKDATPEDMAALLQAAVNAAILTV